MNDLARNLLLWLVVAVVLAMVFQNFSGGASAGRDVAYSDFIEDMLAKRTDEQLQGLRIPEPRLFEYEPGRPELDHDLLALVSYPRSGNTLLRAYLEKITGIATGSGGQMHDRLIRALREGGFHGETITDKRVAVVKTHSPERSGLNAFEASRAILLVRNPLDVLVSQFCMVATASHHLSISDADWSRQELRQIFEDFVRQEITVWVDFHEFWIKMRDRIPIHIVRYEDLIEQPQEPLERLSKFVLAAEDISATKAQKLVEIAAAEARPENYRPREGKINKNLDKFSQKLRNQIAQEALPLLHSLGYFKYLGIFGDKKTVSEDNLRDIAAHHGLDFDQLKEPSAFVAEFNRESDEKLRNVLAGVELAQTVTINRLGAMRNEEKGAYAHRGFRPHTRPWRERLARIGGVTIEDRNAPNQSKSSRKEDL